MPHLENLYTLLQDSAQGARKRGAIDFEFARNQDASSTTQGKIERIVPLKRNDAHKLIEECMLAANVCASDFLHENKQPALYRIHEGPTPEKLEALRELPGRIRPAIWPAATSRRPRTTRRCSRRSRTGPMHGLLQTVMLRSLKQAVYSPDNMGHFGLAYEAYTHFTSPIRRYPDLLVHRGIKAVLKGEKLPGKGLGKSACTARRPSAAPTMPPATSRPGSSATTCRTASATSTTAPSAR